MKVITFSEARRNWEAVLQRVVDDHEPITVARPAGGSVVLVSLADWEPTDVTARLLSSPTNAARLEEAVAQLDASRGE
jgi:antitoxin YefM